MAKRRSMIEPYWTRNVINKALSNLIYLKIIKLYDVVHIVHSVKIIIINLFRMLSTNNGRNNMKILYIPR